MDDTAQRPSRPAPHRQEAERLAALARYDILDTPREQDFDDIATLASEICGTPIAVVNLVGDVRQWFKAEVGLGVQETPLETSFCGHAILQQDFMLVADATKDPRFDGNPLVTGEPGLRFYAGALLKTEEGHPIGTLCVLDHKPRELSDWQVSALKRLARQVMGQLELRRALREQRESEHRFRNMADHAPVMMWVADPTGYCTFVNRRWCELTGQTEEEAQGFGWFDATHPDDRQRVEETFRSSNAAHEAFRVEYRLRSASGSYRWVLDTASPHFGKGGEYLGYVGAVLDIHERRSAEEQLVETTRRLDAILSNTTMAVFMMDDRQHCIYMNDAAEKLTGYTLAETQGRPLHDVVHHTRPDGTPFPLCECPIDQALPENNQEQGEEVFVHKDGSFYPVAFTASPMRDVAGQPIGTVIEVRNIEEELRAKAALDAFHATLERRVEEEVAQRQKAEEALRQAQKMEAIGQLTGGVAHDFNNLLTIIRSSTDLLRRPNLPEERRTRYVDAIADTVERASKLTGQLLAFARRQALKPEVFDLPERVRAVADMLRTIVGSRIQIVTEIACGSCLVEADVAQFETALINMAVNARDAMEGEGTLTIRVEGLSHIPPIRAHAGSPGSFVAVSLRDTGCGIPADKLAQIFEPFFTTKEVGKGTGLGLSQVFGFAKQSGGDVDVESEAGRGTAFTLYLPQASSNAKTNRSSVRNGDTTASEHGQGRRVLVVEDNVEVGRFSTQILQDLGYQTTWAANADEALRRLAEGAEAFDVVFSDVVMPGMSGIDLGQEIRRRHPNLPVVLTSGYSEVLAEKGTHGFELLHKPYAADELSQTLRKVIQ